MEEKVSQQIISLRKSLESLKESIERETELLDSLQTKSNENFEKELKKRILKIYVNKWKNALLKTLVNHNSPNKQPQNQKNENSEIFLSDSIDLFERENSENDDEGASAMLKAKRIISLVLTSSSDDEWEARIQKQMNENGMNDSVDLSDSDFDDIDCIPNSFDEDRKPSGITKLSEILNKLEKEKKINKENHDESNKENENENEQEE